MDLARSGWEVCAFATSELADWNRRSRDMTRGGVLPADDQISTPHPSSRISGHLLFSSGRTGIPWQDAMGVLLWAGKHVVRKPQARSHEVVVCTVAHACEDDALP